MKTYLCDTHALAWYLTQDPRLGPGAHAAFEEAEDGDAHMLIPTIVLAELLYVSEKKRVTPPFKQLLHLLSLSQNYLTVPLDFSTVLRAQGISRGDLHDRLIVASAKMMDAVIISRDSEIRKIHAVAW